MEAFLMTTRFLAFFLMIAGFAGGAAAQQACTAEEVPVGVISMGGETFHGLSAQDFLPSKGFAVKSITFDSGPRRVLFVVDTSKKLSANTHRAVTELVNALVAASRPEDSLALITARGPGGEVKFGEDRAGIARALASPEADGVRSKGGVLDALLEGAGWFSGSQSGDAVVLIAADLDGNHKANPKTASKALADHHLRMFGLALGPLLVQSTVATKTVTNTVSQGLGYARPLTGVQVLQDGDSNYYPLVTNSGGLLLPVVNNSTDQGVNLNDPKVQEQVRYKGHQVFGMIMTFYRAQVEEQKSSHPQGWSLDVSESLRKGQPPMFLLYPRELGPC
jgi:hypothetical protein